MSEKARPVLLLAAILAVQALISLPRLNQPFVDGRVHWQHDDAFFLLRALHSLDGALPDARKVFGVARYVYDAEGRPTAVTHYSHHPVLANVLFRVWVAVTGPAHWSPRLFALLVSMGTTVVLLGLLRRLLQDDWLAAGLTLLYDMLPLYAVYQDAWKHEALATLLFLLCARLVVEAPTSPRAARALPFALAALANAEWAVWAAGAGLVLLARRKDAALGLAAGAALAVAIALWLGFTPAVAVRQAAYRAGAQLEGVGVVGWASRQAGFLTFNFGPAVVAAGAALLAAAAAGVRGRGTGPGLVVFAAGAAWVCLFRNLSHVHHYIQWYLGTGFILMAAGFFERLEAARRRAAAFALLPLIALSVHAQRAMEADIWPRLFGAPEDVAVLAFLKERVVFDLNGVSGPRDWWLSPNAALYADPVYKREALGLADARGGLASFEQAADFDPRRDRLVALDEPGAPREAARRLGYAGALSVIERSPTFLYLGTR